MPQLKGTDENGNEWSLRMECSNPKYPNRFDLKVHFNDCDYTICRYSTYLQAMESWRFLEKFSKEGTPFEKMPLPHKKPKKELEDG